ncbi:MAG TPA: hypothetical protein VFB90_00495 [Dehalococcoidia bacterium]|nr:hypothetical protein [Dehalococcoidia bacterium]
MEGVLEVTPEQLEVLSNQGRELPYVEFNSHVPAIKLDYQGESFWYYKTLPLKGYSALLARELRDLESQGRQVLLARFNNRIYIYGTGVTPIGAGKAPAA